jgi:hypothetical protein
MPGNSKVVLSLTYNEVARRLLMHQKPEQISQAMAIPIGTLTQMMRRPDFLVVMEKVREKTYEDVDKQLGEDAKGVRQKIIDIQGDSFDRLKLLMEHAASEGIQKDIAQDFLDRGGHTKAPEKAPQVQITINPIEADVIADALHREKEGRKRLEKLTITLAKPAGEVEHPAFLKEDNDEPSTRND